MGASKKSRQQLIEELEALHARIAELEQNIPESRQVKEKLCKWDHVFEHAGWGILIGSADGKKIETMNPAFARMHGYKVEELIGCPIVNVFAPENRSELHVQIQIAHERGHHDFESNHIRKDGSVFPVMVHVTVVRDEYGSVQYRVVHVEDLSEWKREEAMLRTQRRLVILLGSATDLSEGLGYLLEAACQIDGIDCGGIFLVDRQTGAFDMVSNRGLSPDFVKGSFHFNANTTLARMAMAGWSVFWDAQDVVPEGQDVFRRNERLRALGMIPVLQGGKVVAILSPASRTHDTIDTSARNALASIAAQIGEIIARTNKEEALLESQRNLKSLFDAMDDFLFVLDKEGKILRINPALRLRLGYFGMELVGSSIFKIYPPDRQKEIEAILDDLMAGTMSICHIPLITKKGDQIPVETKIVQSKWDSNDALIGLARDITRRRQDEEALRLSEERFRSLVETSGDLVWEVDQNGVYTYVSPKVTDSLGYLPEEIIGKSIFDLMSQEEISHLSPIVQHIMQQAEPFIALENTNLHKDGHVVVLETSGVPILDADGNLLGYRGIDRDITERQRAEDLIRLRLRLWEYAAACPVDELMQKALDEIEKVTNSPISFYHIVEEDQKTLLLQAWSTQTLQEYCRAEGKGLHYNIDQAGVWVDCIHERKPVVHNNYAALLHRKGMPDGHAKVIRELVVPTMRDGLVVSILGVGNKPTDYDEKDVELVAYVADVVWEIVERKRSEEMLHQANTVLQARNEELDAFGHTVAHDLKNPLSNIISLAYMLEDKENPLTEEEADHLIQAVKQMGLKMDSIIEELMLLAGLRKTEVKMEPLNMDNIITDSLERLAQPIEKFQATIVCPANWPEALGYAPWVEEVWTNYVNNAIKYGGRPPHIELGAEREGDHIRFWIHDNGPGLTIEEQERLFTPFERLGQTHLAGHGLGLSIAQRIVERMGGQVSVKSSGVAGEGSTFSFTLPAV